MVLPGWCLARCRVFSQRKEVQSQRHFTSQLSQENDMSSIPLQVSETTAQAATSAKSGRLYFADHLRATLAILVVLHHIAIVYGASTWFYYIEPPLEDLPTFTAFLVFVLFNQAWFMGAFFFLAGYFTPGSYDRKGSGAFLKDRLIRLGIPILVFTFVLSPIAFLGRYLMPPAISGVTEPLSWEAYPDLIGLGPLWFVAMLLIFSLGYALWRRLRGNRASAAPSKPSSPGYLLVAGFVLGLALVSFLFRMIVPLGQPVSLFVYFLSFPTIAYLPQYLSFFVLGIIASRYDWLRTLPASMGIVGLIATILAAVILFPLAFSGEPFSLALTPVFDNATGNGHWQSAVYVLWDSIFSVGLILALIPFFRAFFNTKSRLGTFLAQHSYAVYILHIPIIVFLAYALRDVELSNNLVKFALASLIMVPICFVVAYLVRKIPLVSRVL